MHRTRPAHEAPIRKGPESVWDYPRPPRVEPCFLPITVEFGGIVLARSDASFRVVETASPPVFYLPPDDVQVERLQRSTHASWCEWKGRAEYWTVTVGERRAIHAAWSYPDPRPGYEALRGYFAFYAGKMDRCLVGDQPVDAQAGDFYGGWITPDIVGPFKGDPGTEHW